MLTLEAFDSAQADTGLAYQETLKMVVSLSGVEGLKRQQLLELVQYPVSQNVLKKMIGGWDGEGFVVKIKPSCRPIIQTT